MAQLNEIDESLEEEIETINSMYPEQISSADLNPMLINCIFKMNDKYIIQVKFSKPKDEIIISISNNEKCVERFPKRSLEKIQSKLLEICKEEYDAMPIYQCLSYLNDSFIDDMESLGIQWINNDEKKKKKKQTNDNNIINNIEKDKNDDCDLPLITIYTWGNKCRKNAPNQSQHNTNVCGVVGYKPRGLNLKQLTGKDEQIQKYVENGKNYERYSNNLKNKIINEGLDTISINCHKGRHRSVAFAELLAKDLRDNYGYKVSVFHLESLK